jgi:cellulose biosynthesis protein BcsQ
MSIPIIAFFNNKGGVGKTSLVYHLAWMYRELGLRVIAVDLDPQANLTAAFLSEEKLEEIWLLHKQPNTIFRCVQPLLRGIGDINAPQLEPIAPGLALLVGDLLLSGFEDNLAAEWPGCMDRKELSFRVISAIWRIIQRAVQLHQANVVLLDLGPNLGAINRTALIAADFVVVPLSPDLFSLQGLRNLGPTLKRWRLEWTERVHKNPVAMLKLPAGRMQPVGYTLLQYWNHHASTDRPAKAYQRWIAHIPNTYRQTMMGTVNETMTIDQDPYCLATIKHYKSLMPLAQAVHKPIFQLQSSDGALGASIQVAYAARQDFELLARNIARNCKSYRMKTTTS